MPLNVRRFSTSALTVLVFLFSLAAGSRAQTITPSSAIVPQTPTSGDVMRERITKAKAYIAVRNYNAAIYELENIRKETADTSVQGVVNVLLMNSYLEQGDYKRAQELLNEFYTAQKTSKPNAAANYMAVAGQVVKGARSRAERYRALGLNVGDKMLPLEALNDLEKMRETVEIVITQSKEIGQTPAKTADAMALLEEATTSRSMLGRDDYDSRRWKDEVADTREQMTNSRSVVLSAISGEPSVVAKTDTATNQPKPLATPPVNQPVTTPVTPAVTQPASQPAADTRNAAVRDREVKTTDPVPSSTSTASNDKPVYVPMPVVKEEPNKDEPKKEEAKKEIVVSSTPSETAIAANTEPTGPIDVGSLLGYATKQTPAVYPPAAKSVRATGVVKVEVTVDEKGDVTDIQKTVGPTLLQSAAKEAVRKWKFKPFVKNGQPVKATGFVSFNFSM